MIIRKYSKFWTAPLFAVLVLSACVPAGVIVEKSAENAFALKTNKRMKVPEAPVDIVDDIFQGAYALEPGEKETIQLQMQLRASRGFYIPEVQAEMAAEFKSLKDFAMEEDGITHLDMLSEFESEVSDNLARMPLEMLDKVAFAAAQSATISTEILSQPTFLEQGVNAQEMEETISTMKEIRAMVIHEKIRREQEAQEANQ